MKQISQKLAAAGQCFNFALMSSWAREVAVGNRQVTGSLHSTMNRRVASSQHEPPATRLATTSRPQQYPYDTRRHKVGQRSGDHCTEAQSGEIMTTVGRQRAQSPDLDANRAEVCEAA